MTTVSEQSIHETVWALFQAFKAPGALIFHVPNGEKRGPRVAAKLARMGVVAGVPDFVCMARGRVCFLELKRAKGRVSTAQAEFCGQAYAHGVTTHVARSVEEAVEFLQNIGVLRADIKFSSGDADAFARAQGGPEVLASGPSPKFTQEAATSA